MFAKPTKVNLSRGTPDLVLGAFLAIVLFTTPAIAQSAVVNPEGTDLYFLQQQLAHTTPAYETLADMDNTVRQADEFHRQDARQKAEARLRAKAASVAGTKTLIINLSSRFGEYDDKYKEYDLDLSDGTYIPFQNVFGREVRLALTNGNQAQTWKLEPSDAAAVLKKTNGNRYVILVLTLDVLGARPSVDREPMIINTKITGYEVLAGSGNNARLGKVVVGR